MKLVLKNLLFCKNTELGTLGEKTPIKDREGIELDVGDLVIVKSKGRFLDLSIVVKIDDKCFVFGVEKSFNLDGTYNKNNIEITYVDTYANLKANDVVVCDYSYKSFELVVVDDDKAKEEQPKYYNAKVVCVEAKTDKFTKGKVYEIKDGLITDDKGTTYSTQYKNIDSLNYVLRSQFIELKD